MLKILIIKPSSLGDIIHGLQVVQSLREQLPDCHISWVAREMFAPIIQMCRTVDETFVFERHGGVLQFFKLIAQLRGSYFDVVMDFQGLIRSGLMAFAARSPRKIGRTDVREGGGYFVGERAPLPPAGKEAHAVEILLAFLPLLGLRAEVRGAPAFVDAPIRHFDSELLTRRPIVMFPDSRRPEKEWWGFGELTERLIAHGHDGPIIWAGSSRREPPAACQVPNFVNLIGKTGLPELVTLIRHAQLVIGNDSGAMHIAAALEIPVLAVFGPTPANRYGPYPPSRPSNHVIQATDGDLRQLAVATVWHHLCQIIGK